MHRDILVMQKYHDQEYALLRAGYDEYHVYIPFLSAGTFPFGGQSKDTDNFREALECFPTMSNSCIYYFRAFIIRASITPASSPDTLLQTSAKRPYAAPYPVLVL